MTQPTPAPPAPQPLNSPNWYADIESINWQLMAEQPATAATLAILWNKFYELLLGAAQAMRNVAVDLTDWESPEAREAFETKNDQAIAVLDDAVETATTVSRALHDLSLVMRLGQEKMQELYTEYQAAMRIFDDADRLGQMKLLDQQEYATGQAFLADGTTRGRFRGYWNQRAMDLAAEISRSYVEANVKLFTADFTDLPPLDYVFHPRSMGMQFPSPDGPGVGPPAAPAPVAPPAPGGVPATPAAPPPPALSPTAPPVPVAAPPAPAGTQPAVSPPVGPPGAPGIGPASVVPMPPPGAAPGLFAPPAGRSGTSAPTGSVVGPPNAARFRSAATPDVIGPPTGSADSSALPPGTLMPPGMPGAMRPPVPPGTPGAMRPPAAPGNRPDRPGGAPPGSSAPGHRPDRPGATPSTAGPPEAFLPPAGMSPPVLGDPQRRSPQARPGGPGEAPRQLRPPTAASLGGSVPPVLTNRHHTGPRPTEMQRREDSRLARQERIRRYRELLKSEIAKDVPDATTSVLDGRLGARGDSPTRTPEVSDLLQGRQATAPAPAPRLAVDQATRRRVTNPPAAPTPTEEQPAVVDDRSAWEVQTPGGPVVAGAPNRNRRPRRPPGGRR